LVVPPEVHGAHVCLMFIDRHGALPLSPHTGWKYAKGRNDVWKRLVLREASSEAKSRPLVFHHGSAGSRRERSRRQQVSDQQRVTVRAACSSSSSLLIVCSLSSCFLLCFILLAAFDTLLGCDCRLLTEIEDSTSVEITQSGFYQTVCVEIDIQGLAVNTILEVGFHSSHPIATYVADPLCRRPILCSAISRR